MCFLLPVMFFLGNLTHDPLIAQPLPSADAFVTSDEEFDSIPATQMAYENQENFSPNAARPSIQKPTSQRKRPAPTPQTTAASNNLIPFSPFQPPFQPPNDMNSMFSNMMFMQFMQYQAMMGGQGPFQGSAQAALNPSAAPFVPGTPSRMAEAVDAKKPIGRNEALKGLPVADKDIFDQCLSKLEADFLNADDPVLAKLHVARQWKKGTAHWLPCPIALLITRTVAATYCEQHRAMIDSRLLSMSTAGQERNQTLNNQKPYLVKAM